MEFFESEWPKQMKILTIRNDQVGVPKTTVRYPVSCTSIHGSGFTFTVHRNTVYVLTQALQVAQSCMTLNE
jgi:hypothetical protein